MTRSSRLHIKANKATGAAWMWKEKSMMLQWRVHDVMTRDVVTLPEDA